MLFVKHIERKGPGSSMVMLEDGSFFLISHEQALMLDLQVGCAVDSAELERAAVEHEQRLAYEKAAALLASRGHSTGELERKLRKRSFSENAIRYACDLLTEQGYLDDLEFAREFVQQRIRQHPEGRAALAGRLFQRGIARHLIDQALSELLDDDTYMHALERAARTLSARGKAGNRLIAALVRKSFDPASVKAFVREHYSAENGSAIGSDTGSEYDDGDTDEQKQA